MITALPSAEVIVDASNVTSGGVLGHLRSLLRQAGLAPFASILVIGGADQAGDFTGLDPRVSFHADPALPNCKWRRGGWSAVAGYLGTTLAIHRWRNHVFPGRARAAGARVLLAANGILPDAVPPGLKTVAISHNMLPFAPEEWPSLGWGLQRLRVMALRRTQGASFRRADGLIFLSEHARTTILAAAGIDPAQARCLVAPLGIDHALFHPPASRRETLGSPINCLYVSSLDRYKHHVEVAEAVFRVCRETGRAIHLHLAGWQDGRTARHFAAALRALGFEHAIVRHGVLAQPALAELYRAADIFLFASTCENCPTILIEAMASALPIACTAAPPMTEVAGAGAIGFDARDPGSIAAALGRLVVDAGLRRDLAARAEERARAFTAERHARAAWDFIAATAGRSG
jgi:glycosyltransferase involved in cell wall biosynthesis